jgi:hypothetical protein
MVVDHINRNGLYNRQRNLRICTHAQNCCNRVLYKPHNSRFQGVQREKRSKKWIGQAYLKGHRFHCGTFDNEEAAARARDYKTVQLHGPYAYLNFPDEWPFARRQAVYDEYQARPAEPQQRRKKASPQRSQRSTEKTAKRPKPRSKTRKGRESTRAGTPRRRQSPTLRPKPSSLKPAAKPQRQVR